MSEEQQPAPSKEQQPAPPGPIGVPKEKVTTAAMVPVTSGGIAIQNLDELMKFSRMLVDDGAAPKRWTPGQVAIAIQSGLQAGLGLMGGIQQGVVINGNFTWKGQAAVALIQNSGKCKPGTLDFGCRGEGEQREGWAVAHRVGDPRPKTRTFSVDDARLAVLWNKDGPWKQYPDRQLAWRAIGFLARDVFPDVLGGFPLAEEAVDFDEKAERPTRQQRPELSAPPSPDTLMEAIAGKPEVVEAELVPDVSAPPTEGEQPSLLEPEDKCDHGVVLSVSCVDCDDQEAVLAAEKEG